MRWTKRTKRTVIFLLIILLLAGILALYFGLLSQEAPAAPVERFEQAAPKVDQTPPPQPVTAPESAPAPEPVPESYQSPVDFALLQAVNEDIYAWLDIPGTDISYPLLQRSDDDTFYLTHDAEGNKNRDGALYTEASCNDQAFEDPVTVIYGHQMLDGLMFSKLQEHYSEAGGLEKYSEIVIYLPERELHFTVVAAVPYDNRHILRNYDFTDRRTFRLFFDELLSVRAMEAAFSEDASIQSGDQVLILSTCLIGKRSSRYLVCAKLPSET